MFKELINKMKQRENEIEINKSIVKEKLIRQILNVHGMEKTFWKILYIIFWRLEKALLQLYYGVQALWDN